MLFCALLVVHYVHVMANLSNSEVEKAQELIRVLSSAIAPQRPPANCSGEPGPSGSTPMTRISSYRGTNLTGIANQLVLVRRAGVELTHTLCRDNKPLAMIIFAWYESTILIMSGDIRRCMEHFASSPSPCTA